MKITCQACQSKYTVADDKIHGKVAKIRCKKCGATVLVDASAGSQANGAAESEASGKSLPGDVWQVNVADGDQRTMRPEELVDAYNSGVIDAQTYLWKEGMQDWVPLAQSAEVVELLHRAASTAGAAPAGAASASVGATGPAASAGVGTAASASTVATAASASTASDVSPHVAPQTATAPQRLVEPVSSARTGATETASSYDSNGPLAPHAAFSAPTGSPARREPARPQASDLFGSKKPDDEEVATSAPSHLVARAAGTATTRSDSGGGSTDVAATGSSSAAGNSSSASGMTGSRDEQSVLFSLKSLTKRASDAPPPEPSPSNSKPRASEDSGLIDLNALAKAQDSQKKGAEAPAVFQAPFLFPAALGQVEVPVAPEVAEQKKSRGRYIAVGGAVALVAIVIAVVAAQKSDEPLPSPTPSVATFSAPIAPEPVPSATQEPSASASVATEAPKPKPGGSRRPGTGKATTLPVTGQQPNAATPPPPPPPPPPRNKCGCPTGDLQCQIRCSATGK